MIRYTRYAALLLAVFAFTPDASRAQERPADPAQAAGEAPSPKLEHLLQSCDAHKFETTVELVVDGKTHHSKVKMCGNEGQSDADWIRSLQDAVDKLKANTQMPAATRDQIIAAITSEIARLKGAAANDSDTGLAPARPPMSAPKPLSDDYSLLPPLPAPAQAPAAPTPRGDSRTEMPLAESPSEDASPPAAAPAAAPKTVTIANPRLRFSCISGDYPGGGPCVTLSRDTIVEVTSPQPVATPLSLRFVRRDQDRAELALGTMRKGQRLRFELPQAICSGVVSSEVQMEVIGAGQVLDRQGPYLLRC